MATHVSDVISYPKAASQFRPAVQTGKRPYTQSVRVSPVEPTGRPPADGALAGRPSPDKWAQQIAVAVVDVIGGRKDARSLQRWMSAEVYGSLRASARLSRDNGGSLPALAMSSRVCRVASETFEFAVTVWDQNRARAVAGRLERLRDRWQLCELETH